MPTKKFYAAALSTWIPCLPRMYVGCLPQLLHRSILGGGG